MAKNTFLKHASTVMLVGILAIAVLPLGSAGPAEGAGARDNAEKTDTKLARAEGIVQKLGASTWMYGTHALVAPDNQVLYALESDLVDLDQYENENVIVLGLLVHEGLDGGPSLIRVLQVTAPENRGDKGEWEGFFENWLDWRENEGQKGNENKAEPPKNWRNWADDLEEHLKNLVENWWSHGDWLENWENRGREKMKDLFENWAENWAEGFPEDLKEGIENLTENWAEIFENRVEKWLEHIENLKESLEELVENRAGRENRARFENRMENLLELAELASEHPEALQSFLARVENQKVISRQSIPSWLENFARELENAGAMRAVEVPDWVEVRHTNVMIVIPERLKQALEDRPDSVLVFPRLGLIHFVVDNRTVLPPGLEMLLRENRFPPGLAKLLHENRFPPGLENRILVPEDNDVIVLPAENVKETTPENALAERTGENEVQENIRIVSVYQAYVTPDDPAVRELAEEVGGVREAYYQAVQWLWVSDQTLNGVPERWLYPDAFLNETPSNPNNPIPGCVASDCEEQAYTLVSVLRALGVSPDNVRVVLGRVKFGDYVGGHAWAELFENGSWLALETTSGPFWSDDEQKLYVSSGLPFDYFRDHPYPAVERWAFFNDVYSTNLVTGETNAPAGWAVGLPNVQPRTTTTLPPTETTTTTPPTETATTTTPLQPGVFWDWTLNLAALLTGAAIAGVAIWLVQTRRAKRKVQSPR